MSLISIVVPVYHNATSLPDLLNQFQALAHRNRADQFEFVFVDDGSRDDSFAVLEALAQTESRVRIIKLSRNFGSNAAVLAGLSHATGDAVAAIAADLQDPPELIHEMLAKWREGNKVILAVREERDDPSLTSFMADTFYMLFRRFAIKTMPRRGFDFFLIDRQVCRLITGIQENNAYLMGLILWMGFDPAVLPYHRRARAPRYGRSMWTFAKKLKYFVDSFVAFSYLPIRVASILGFILSFLGIIYAVIILINRLFSGIDVEGWSSMMVVLLIVSGAQMVMMGVLGEYLWRNLDETRKRPRFIIDRIVESQSEHNVEGEAAIGADPRESEPDSLRR
ncbi:MAG: glycosyltransferase [Anaerolinea sp.]|nr:glycosyltransferase [Anaerolinea sp.]